jgi:hypothetical protein
MPLLPVDSLTDLIAAAFVDSLSRSTGRVIGAFAVHKLERWQ